jgi:hypothetical protein
VKAYLRPEETRNLNISFGESSSPEIFDFWCARKTAGLANVARRSLAGNQNAQRSGDAL